jgi:phosphoribosylanthranilate isomerase
MDTLTQMEQLIQEMKTDAVKLYQQNTKAYAVQLRAKAQTMKVLAQKMRGEAQAHHRGIAGRGKNKTVGGVPLAEPSEPDSVSSM